MCSDLIEFASWRGAVITGIEMCSGYEVRVRDVFEFDRVCIMEGCRHCGGRGVFWVPSENSGCVRI